MKNLEQKLQALESLYPAKDWITTKLQNAYDNLNKQLKVVVDESNGFFSVAIAHQQACEQQPEVAEKMERIANLIAKRDKQIDKKRKAIFDSLALNELEQLIIS